MQNDRGFKLSSRQQTKIIRFDDRMLEISKIFVKNYFMKKVLIIGSGGAGKSTLAKALGKKLNLPVVHLDKEFWRPGWVMAPKTEWQEIIAKLVEGEQWILDGNFDGSLSMRLPHSDTVIFLDFSPVLCLWRLLKRRLKYFNTHRPDMTPGCKEQLDLEFVKWIWRFRKDSRPNITKCLEKYGADKKIILLKKPSDIKAFLKRV